MHTRLTCQALVQTPESRAIRCIDVTDFCDFCVALFSLGVSRWVALKAICALLKEGSAHFSHELDARRHSNSVGWFWWRPPRQRHKPNWCSNTISPVSGVGVGWLRLPLTPWAEHFGPSARYQMVRDECWVVIISANLSAALCAAFEHSAHRTLGHRIRLLSLKQTLVIARVALEARRTTKWDSMWLLVWINVLRLGDLEREPDYYVRSLRENPKKHFFVEYFFAF